MQRQTRLALILGALLALMLGGRGASPAGAEAAAPVSAAAQDAPPRPARVYVGLYLLTLGRLDLASGSYSADFFLTFRCDAPCTLPEFEFLNGRATSVETYELRPGYHELRVQAALVDDFPLNRYPFDRHNLIIALEDKKTPVSDIVFVPDQPHTGVDPKVVVAGWQLDPRWVTHVDEHYYPTFEAAYSRYTFEVFIQRPLLAALLKALLPATFIVIGGMLALLTPPDKILPVVTSTLVSTILFHINSTASLPPLGYLTMADRYMVINYLVLLIVLVAAIQMTVFGERDRPERARALRGWCLRLVPPTWLLLQGLNLALIPSAGPAVS